MLRAMLILFLIILYIGCQVNIEESATSKRLNIIFIMSDDHAEQAISCYGSKLIQTPNIDRIANEGIRFNNGFVTNSICAPSRAVLLTGKYSHLNGLRDNRDHFDGSQVTFPKLLQQADYYTSIVGKWHLKTTPTGFDHWNVLVGQGSYYNPVMVQNGDTSRHIGYTTDLITDFAIESLEKRDSTKPFCLLYHHKAPHRNWMPDPKHAKMFDEDLPIPETFYDDYETRSAAAKEQDMRIDDLFLSLDLKLFPGDFETETGTGGSNNFDAVKSWEQTYNNLTPEQKTAWDAHYDPIRNEFKEKKPSGKALSEWKYQRYIKDYLACVKSVDDNIGRLLNYLDENGLAENTLVIYTSDQGFYLGEHGWYDKRFMYEESLSMPLVARLPGKISANQVTDEIVLNLDFAPTILDFADVDIPEEMQGKSLRPLTEGKILKDWRRSMYYHYYEYPHGWHDVKQHYGIRSKRFKLIHFCNDIDAWELYDLKNDPNELNNLINSPSHQTAVVDLKKELEKLKTQFKDF